MASPRETDATFAVHVDCDNLWIYETEYGVPISSRQDILYTQALLDMLEIFERWNIRATFFIVGKELERVSCVRFCRLAVTRGHRLGNHSLSHRVDFANLRPPELRHEIVAGDAAIVAATGHKPIGFRGPGYHINATILTTLAELGYRYDSSILPGPAGCLMKAYILIRQGKTAKSFGTWTSILASQRPHPVGTAGGRQVWEYPIATFPVVRMPIHSTFIYILGDPYLRLALGWLRKRPGHHVYLLHAIDALAHPEPEVFGGRVVPLRRSFDDRMRFLGLVCQQLEGRVMLTEDNVQRLS